MSYNFKRLISIILLVITNLLITGVLVRIIQNKVGMAMTADAFEFITLIVKISYILGLLVAMIYMSICEYITYKRIG